MEGRLTGFSLNRDGSQNVTVTVTADFSSAYDELEKAPVEITIKKAQKHRSMEANRYAWVLIDQIAAKMHMKKSEIYRNAIREIGGVSKPMVMKEDAVPVFLEIWEKQGLGNQAVVDDVDEFGWAYLTVYFGSSTYDSAQMSALLDSLIQDAEALGIPTITPKEEAKMLGKWATKKEREGKHHGDEDRENHAGDCGKVPEDEHGQLPEAEQGEGEHVRGGNEGREVADERRGDPV